MNEKRYWLRGGVVTVLGAGIILVLAFLATVFTSYCNGDLCSQNRLAVSVIDFMLYPYSIIQGDVTKLVGGQFDGGSLDTLIEPAAMVISYIIFYFVIGSLLGLAYKKLFSRSRE